WLVLEWIPKPLPRKRWLADPEVITALRQVHQLDLAISHAGWFAPCWTQDMTSAFFRWASHVDRALLERLRARAQALFEPRVWISGDPNPTNWGLHSNGRLALFDWERFGRGTPALDLAITVPGLGAREDFARVTRAYGVSEMAESNALAKAWTLVEFVSQAEGQRIKTLDRLRPAVAEWLRSITN